MNLTKKCVHALPLLSITFLKLFLSVFQMKIYLNTLCLSSTQSFKLIRNGWNIFISFDFKKKNLTIFCCFVLVVLYFPDNEFSHKEFNVPAFSR